jgi:prepilin-type N-terminal cleavage/methylation domain-containing protein/prepilin-type processing-associated H-X9-DG protein
MNPSRPTADVVRAPRLHIPRSTPHVVRASSLQIPCSPAAFTLVELLVVVAVIVVLAGLLLPAVSRSVVSARSARCQSNLRQIGYALALYLADERVYPVGISTRFRGGLQKALRPLDVAAAFRCPERAWVSAEQAGEPEGSGPLRLNPHYGYNWRGTAPIRQTASGLLLMNGPNLGLGGSQEVTGTVVRMVNLPETAVRVPSEMIVAGDTLAALTFPGLGDVTPYDDFVFSLFPHPFRTDPADDASPVYHLGVGDWHHGGANVLLGDGHVEGGRQERWTAGTGGRQRQWNFDYRLSEDAP